LGNGDLSNIGTSVLPEGGNAARRIQGAFDCGCESACSSEITAGCNGNISFFAFGVDIFYFDIVAGVEGDCTAVTFCGCRVYKPCFNVA
jgi:hypothetical protein